MTRSLSKLLTPTLLRHYAGAGAFARGEAYFSQQLVRDLKQQKNKITATVDGTYPYSVALWLDSGELDYSCTCPVYDNGEFCKHGVATGLAWLAKNASESSASQGRGCGKTRQTITPTAVRTWLAQQSKDKLVKAIMAWADENEGLHERLWMLAAQGADKGTRLAVYESAIDRAVQVNGFVDYREMSGYAQGINAVLDTLEGLFRKGQAAEVIGLCEYALGALESVMGLMDDSDGYTSGIFERLQTLHLAACRKASPEPEALARRLFAWELSTEWGSFFGAAKTYAKLLGKPGLAVYRELAEEEWRKVPPLKAGDSDRSSYGKRFRITKIMECLAEQSGDVDAQVAVLARDLSHAYGYLRVAELLRRARRNDEAMAWAERGLKAFAHSPDPRLQDFLAAEYHRRKRHDEAMQLIWAQFTAHSCVENYHKLKQHAGRMRAWPAWRGKALAALRDRCDRQSSQKMRGIHYEPSVLVDILLSEKDVEGAWKSAGQYGCSDAQWLQLADRRGTTHPLDAIAVYQRQVDPLVRLASNQSYAKAAALLRKIGALMRQSGQGAEFREYLAGVRASHKQKRNFVKLVDALH